MYKFGAGERLCENVGNHVVGGTIDNESMPISNGLADKMEAIVDMLGACVERSIFGQRDGRLIMIVTEKSRWSGDWYGKFDEKFPEPEQIFGSVSESDILGFCAR
jgi:hypothetical protein